MLDRQEIIHHYKNTREKLLQTNAAIWFNKMCRFKQLTPKHNQIKEEIDVCRKLTRETTCNQQPVILSFYNNISNAVYLPKTCTFDIYDYCQTILLLYVVTTLVLAP
jgi:hypothetical protein